jgi:molybdopterin/thiamine biosynthesis adenylyltransferase
MGQELRCKTARWYQSESLRHFIQQGSEGGAGSLKFSIRFPGENAIIFLHEATSVNGASSWRDKTIPQNIPGASPAELYSGVWFMASHADAARLCSVSTVEDLQFLAIESGHNPELLTPRGSSTDSITGGSLRAVVVMDSNQIPHLFLLGSSGIATRFTSVQSEPSAQRRSGKFDVSSKQVGIVGLGSMGSKIAMTLARMGIKNFYLVDHDVFLPENAVRHALDWQSVCQHKVDAMALTLPLIAADVKVSVRSVHLTGQESNALVSAALNQLGSCDLIIDATAEPRVFNLLSAAARSNSRPLVWAEVFAGGIGGMVARSRPTLDPTPATMRAIYHQYCSEHPAPQQPARDYVLEDQDALVIAASDADVGIIAHHTARLAWDTLVAKESQYPYSLYLIGLTKAWVFEAPFSTLPIATATYQESLEEADRTTELGQDNVAFLGSLLEKLTNAAPSPS